MISAVNTVSPSAPVKAEAAPLPTAMSSTAKPSIPSEKVNVAMKAAMLVADTPVIVTVGAVLSTTKVLSFVLVGVVFVSALPAVSVMLWLAAKESVTVPSRLPRSPPEAVTS